MSEVTRADIARVMSEANADGATPEDRNAQRRVAVEEFLSTQPNPAGTQGREHDMILSDLPSYKEWEDDSASSQVAQRRSTPPWRRQEVSVGDSQPESPDPDSSGNRVEPGP